MGWGWVIKLKEWVPGVITASCPGAWVRIQTSLTNHERPGRHKQQSGQRTPARQKIYKKESLQTMINFEKVPVIKIIKK